MVPIVPTRDVTSGKRGDLLLDRQARPSRQQQLDGTQGTRFALDEVRIAADAQYDGKWVLRTNTGLAMDVAALAYKQLWMVEAIFRSMQSLLETRPIYHQRDETIRGHVFCSFLALVLRQELQRRLEQQGSTLEWAEITRDLITCTKRRLPWTARTT